MYIYLLVGNGIQDWHYVSVLLTSKLSSFIPIQLSFSLCNGVWVNVEWMNWWMFECSAMLCYALYTSNWLPLPVIVTKKQFLISVWNNSGVWLGESWTCVETWHWADMEDFFSVWTFDNIWLQFKQLFNALKTLYLFLSYLGPYIVACLQEALAGSQWIMRRPIILRYSYVDDEKTAKTSKACWLLNTVT